MFVRDLSFTLTLQETRDVFPDNISFECDLLVQ